MTKDFIVTGMTCAACAARVEKSVRKLEGVESARVNLLTGDLRVEAAAALTGAQIVSAVTGAGYGAREKGARAGEASPNDEKAAREKEISEMRARMILSFALLAPLMYVSMGHMVGLPLPGFLAGAGNAAVFALAQFLLALPVAYVNRAYYRRGFGALFRRAPNMDSLIALGSSASMIYGVFALFRICRALGVSDFALAQAHAHDLYFESAVMILALINLGKYLETKSKGKTGDAIQKLLRLAPQTALREEGENAVEVPANQLRPGDILRVLPGARVPADGEIIEGEADIDESALTGESMPAEKKPGDRVTGATINLNRFFRMRVARAGEDTAFAQIIRMVRDAGAGKAPIARLADKISGVFVPVVMGIAALAGAAWLLAGADFAFALSRGISVLVISCPCALGLATPVAIMVGAGKGAENGILIRSGEALEAAHGITCAVLDKTGTLTRGAPAIVRACPVGVSEEALLSVAAALEAGSEHPLARAVLSRAKKLGAPEICAANARAVPGRGVQAELDGETCYAGSEAFMRETGVRTDALSGALEAMRKAGETPLLFARGQTLLGALGAADEMRETAPAAVRALADMGVEAVLLTGDNRQTAEAVARKLGISRVRAEVLPADKAGEIARLRAQGKRVCMVGDGINDAPALKTADVGIAIGAGTDVAMESADIILMKSDPMDVPACIRLSRAVMKNIKENLFWAFFYNALGIPVAAGALYPAFGIALSPMLAAAAMSLSSVFVVTNALRLRAFRPAPQTPRTPQTPQTEIKEETHMYTLKIEGMMCAHCQARVEKALNAVEGAKATVDLSKNEAYVQAAPGVAKEALVRAVTDAGYEVVSIA